MAGWRPQVQPGPGHPRAWDVLNTERFSKQKQSKFKWQTLQKAEPGPPQQASFAATTLPFTYSPPKSLNQINRDQLRAQQSYPCFYWPSPSRPSLLQLTGRLQQVQPKLRLVVQGGSRKTQSKS
jgi:hypothetical protein